MSINFNSIFEQTIAGIIVALITWLVTLATSGTSRRLSKSLWKQLQQRWSAIAICLYIFSISIWTHIIYFNWPTTLFVSSGAALTFIVLSVVNGKPRKRVVFYDFRRPLQEWEASKNWNPDIDLVKGIKIEPHMNLTRYLISPTASFAVDSIEYNVILEQNAILNVIFRGRIGTSFNMARLDSRITQAGTLYDCILFSPKGNTGWDVCNKAKKQTGHTSPSGEVINVKIICRQKSAVLIVNGYTVDEVENLQAEVGEGRIVVFTEEASAYLQKLQVTGN